jgi:hypothetical protein
MTELTWQSVFYLGSVGGTMAAAIVVLIALRRRSPRACDVGAAAFGILLIFNTAIVWVSPILVYHVMTQDVVALVIWRYQILMLASAVGHSAMVAILTAAILIDRKPIAGTLPPAE